MTINLEKESQPNPRTRIVATIGPASGSEAVISEMMKAGLDVVRLNFSHGSHPEHAHYINRVRRAASATGKTVAIMQDLPGPKNRTGKLKDGRVELKPGAQFTLTTRAVLGDQDRVSVGIPTLASEVNRGDFIYLDDGSIRLEVIRSNNRDIVCRVISGGILGEEKGVNVPGITLRTPSFTEEDKDHLLFGLKHNVDYVAISYIKEAGDVLKVRQYIHRLGYDTMLVAKIEKQEALDNIDAIIEVSDAVMVARGDLGIEIPVEKVPTAQKEIIRKCNRLGKPVIVATQMLESMVTSPHPSRAEVTDVANAVLDGADAVMLSEETAVGRHPVAAVSTMARIALEAETTLPYDQILKEKGEDLKPETDDAISYAACHIARQLSASAIVAFTASGSTVQRVAKYRPQMPIVAITPHKSITRRLCLFWGVTTFRIPQSQSVTEQFARGARITRDMGITRAGDLVVITGGVPLGVPGTTNMVKVETVK